MGPARDIEHMETSSIVIRTARQDDYVALWNVASLDDSVVPEGPLLVAEADGELVAALSLVSGSTIADPFRRTAQTVELMRLRADQLPRDSARPHGRILRRLRGRPSPVVAQ